MSFPPLSRIEEAEKNFSEKEILDVISSINPELESKISNARQQRFDDQEILSELKRMNRRGTFSDVALQVPVQLIAGLGAIPAFARDAVKGAADIIEDPIAGIGNIIGGLFDAEPFERGKTISQRFFGEELGSQIEDNLGITATRNLLNSLIPALPDTPEIRAFNKFIDDLPQRKELIDFYTDLSGIDLQPQTFLGGLAGEGIGRAAEALPLIILTRGAAARPLIQGAEAAELVRAAGGSERQAQSADVLASLFNLRSPRNSKTPVIEEPLPKQIQSAKDILNEKISALDLNESINSLDFDDPGFGRIKTSETRVIPDLSFEPISDAQLSRDIIRSERDGVLSQVSSEDLSREQALNRVQSSINEQFIRHRAFTSNLYDSVKFKIGENPISMRNTLQEQAFFLNDLPNQGFPQGTESSIRGFLEQQLNLFNPDGSMSVENAIRYKQNLNSFMDFEFPDLTAKRKFKNSISGIRKMAISDLNSGIQRLSPNDAFIDWRRAERSHAQDVERFGKDPIIKIQRGESPLKVLGEVTKPEDFQTLKDAMQLKTQDFHAPESFTLERLALEEISLSKTTESLERVAEDFRDKLSPRAQVALDAIIQINDPLSSVSKRNNLQLSVIESIANSSLTGEPPVVPIKLGMKPRGLQIVRDALSKSPEHLRVVEQSIMNEIVSSIETDGVINTNDLNNLLKNNDLLSVMNMIEGREFVDSLRELNNTRMRIDRIFTENAFKKNLSKLKAQKIRSREIPQKELIFRNPNQWFRENFQQSHLALEFLKFLGVKKPVIAAVGSFTGFTLIKKYFPKLLKKPKIKSILNFIETKPENLASSIILLNKAIEDEIRNEKEKEPK